MADTEVDQEVESEPVLFSLLLDYMVLENLEPENWLLSSAPEEMVLKIPVVEVVVVEVEAVAMAVGLVEVERPLVFRLAEVEETVLAVGLVVAAILVMRLLFSILKYSNIL
jgi:hypothetical protein